jgi:Acyl-CoA dehydrogenase, C-terminal domain
MEAATEAVQLLGGYGHVSGCPVERMMCDAEIYEGTSQVRRFAMARQLLKEGTRLAGIPLDPRATYIMVDWHPLDMAVSLYYRGDNIDRVRMRELTGQPEPARPRPGSLRAACLAARRHMEPGRRVCPVERAQYRAVHYDDLPADLAGEMRAGRAARDCGAGAAWLTLADVATFRRMRASAEQDDRLHRPLGVLKSRQRSSGAARTSFWRGPILARPVYSERKSIRAADSSRGASSVM